jgi:hypothetical protein
MLVGKSGFLLHNLPLLLLLPGCVILIRRRVREAPELLAALAACAGMWLVYAVGSRNYSGGCCSIRWFVPMLGPAFLGLAVVLRELPMARSDLVLLSIGGSLVMFSAWAQTLWPGKYVPGFWYFLAATLIAWGVLAVRRGRVQSAASREEGTECLSRAA